jgi:hypothetical protein
MRRFFRITVAIIGAFLASSTWSGVCAAAEPTAALSQEEANAIAIEAYHFLYPLVTMDVTRRVTTNYSAGVKPGMGPANHFHHLRAFPTADFREVVRPNFDTLYSSAWLDLRLEPMIISVPDKNGRYYLLPMLDMWSDVFAVPGKRTSGTQARHFGLVPKNWRGSLPAGIERIEAQTAFIWIIGRTQTNGPQDYPAVAKVQDGYTITPLSAWGKPAKSVQTVVDVSVDMKADPLSQVNGMDGKAFFSSAAEIMKENPPHATDWSQVSRLKRLGIEPGKSFDFAKAPAVVRTALDAATKEAMKQMQEKLPTLARVANGWQMNTDTIGVYGNFYLKRAIVAMVGLGANQPEDAIYPLLIADHEGKALEGGKEYVLRFGREELPPVNAFWSVTMYDEKGFQIPNSLNRFAIGDRDALKFESDGSLKIYIQASSPGQDKESNWLPAPEKGRLGVTMRLYAPRAAALDGRWVPPPVRRVVAPEQKS